MLKWILSLLLIGFTISCLNSRKVSLTVIGGDDHFVKIYNGNVLILEDTLSEDYSTSISSGVFRSINFSDSIIVISSCKEYEERSSIKLKRVKYIYIDHRGVNFNIIGCNEEKAFY